MQLMTTEAIEKLKQLHRGELAAIETYDQALAKVDDPEAAERLRQIQVRHRQAAELFHAHLREIGIVPDQSSKGWGAFAKLVEAAANFLGDSATLRSLKEGEKFGLSTCEVALQEDLPDECRKTITDTYMPQLREHIRILDKLLER